MLAALLVVAVTAAQDEVEPVRDAGVVPAAGLATEAGPGVLYVNPANLAYDPDPAWGAYFRYEPDLAHRTAGALTGHIAGLAAGFRWQQHTERGPDFSVDLGAGVRLPRRVALGAAVRWSILAEARNFVAFDAAASWRPLPWFGLSVLTRNIGNPGGDGFAVPQTGAGIALRPLGRVLVLGADWLHSFGVDAPRDVFSFTARVRPTGGLFVRAGLDSRLSFVAGLEVFFGGRGLGVFAGTDDYTGVPTVVGFVGTDERDEHVAPPRRQVTSLELEATPPYAPEPRLLARDVPSWLETLEHIRRAAETPQVRGMLLTLGDVELSWAQWTELRDAIRRLRSLDKEVVVLLVGAPGNGAVYAASAASRLLLHPASEVRLVGLSAEAVHLRGLLDSLGVNVQVVRRSEYKTAAEPLTATEMSDAERQQLGALLDQRFTELVGAIADGRARTREDVLAWVDGGPWSAAEAVRLGLVDDRAYPDQAQRVLEQLHGPRVQVVDLGDRPEPRSPWEPPEQIAVLYVEGTIVRGESSPGGLLSGPRTGSSTVTELLRAAARDPATRAVVLRVDSPGGSAFASDEIWRTVEEVQASGKPVVVSLGGTAASGGYYVASGADAIWAEPTTVTGSIGVLALKPNVAPLLDRVGVGATRLTRGRNAGLDSPLFPWDPVQEARVQALVDETYRTFKDRVAQGRGLTTEQVETVARGRVWSGTQARELGLVDELGGLTEALRDAARRAGIPERRPVAYVGLRTRRSLVERILPDLSGLALRATLARAERSLAGPQPSSLAGAGMLRPLRQAMLVGEFADETLWMLDPWVLEVTSR